MTQEQIESIDYTQPPKGIRWLIFFYYFAHLLWHRMNYDGKIVHWEFAKLLAKKLTY
jgi:hypothetical protein